MQNYLLSRYCLSANIPPPFPRVRMGTVRRDVCQRTEEGAVIVVRPQRAIEATCPRVTGATFVCELKHELKKTQMADSTEDNAAE